jgi:hypothetical protein
MSTPNPTVSLMLIMLIILLLSSLHREVRYIMFIPIIVTLLWYNVNDANRILACECVTPYLQQEVQVFWLSSYGHLINIPRMFQSWVNISPRAGQ